MIIQNAPIGIFVVDKNDEFVQFNKTMESISGLKASDVIGTNLLEDIPKQTLEGETNFKKLYLGVKSSLEEATFKDMPITTPIGTLSYQTTTLHPLMGIDGAYDGMVVYVEEVSDFLQREKNLLDNLNHTRELNSFYSKDVPVIAFRWSVEKGWPIEMVSDNISQYGYSVDDFTSGRVVYSDIIHPDDFKRVRNYASELEAGNGAYLFNEYRILDSSGNSVWVNEISSLELDKNGLPSHYNGILIDVTDRVNAEKSLTREREYLNSITSNLEVGVCIISQDYRTIWANDFLKSLYGDIEGKLCHVAYNKKSEVCENCAVRDLIETGKVKAICEQKGVDMNGSPIWSHIVAVPLYDNDGNITSYMEIIVPVTEMKLAEVQVRESNARIESILRATPVGLGVVSDRVFEEVNDKLCEMLGYSQEDFIGQSTRMIYPSDEDYGYVGREKYTQISKNGYGTVETHMLCKDGAVIDVLLSSSPIYPDDLSKGVTFAVLDITELKNTQRKLENYTAELEQINHLKDLFSDIIRHDLLSPAGIVRGYAEILTNMEADDAKLDILHVIEENNDKIINLIESAAKYEKINSLDEIDFYNCDIVKIFQNVVVDMGPVIKNKNISVNIRSDGPCFSFVNSIISEVFLNLVSNAIKYGPENEVIAVDFQDAGSFWKVMVIDQGVGIADADKDHVFERFKRVDKKGVKGTGLGLAIVKRVMELHGGGYGVEDNPEGRGCVFWITLKKS